MKYTQIHTQNDSIMLSCRPVIKDTRGNEAVPPVGQGWQDGEVGGGGDLDNDDEHEVFEAQPAKMRCKTMHENHNPAKRNQRTRPGAPRHNTTSHVAKGGRKLTILVSSRSSLMARATFWAVLPASLPSSCSAARRSSLSAARPSTSRESSSARSVRLFLTGTVTPASDAWTIDKPTGLVWHHTQKS